MKNFRLCLIFIFFNISLFANVTLQAPNSFIKGESYIFQLTAIGSSITFPKIEKIEGNIVEELGTSRSLQIINGNYDEKLSKKYRIIPQSDFLIPSFTFEIDGKKVQSPSKKITQEQVHKTSSQDFDLTLIPSKTKLYVGEDLLVKLIFKYKKNLQITNLGFQSPHFENFWYKKRDSASKRYEENGFIVQELEFLLFPQKSGELKIEPLKIDVQMIESSNNSNISFFGARPVLEKVYSNELSFQVQDLPSNVNLLGNFDINAYVDKQKVKAGESISYKLQIKGNGNFDDIQDIKLDIPNATIYDNKPEIKTEYENNLYKGEYQKVFSIVPSSSLIIPSLSIKYFDKEKNKVIEKKTKSFKIEVLENKVKKVVLEKPKVEKEQIKEVVVKQKASLEEKVTYFILGILVTLLIFGLISYVKVQRLKKKIKETPLSKLIKKTKNKQDLMKLLIPYLKNNSSLDELIFECEKDKKEFKDLRKQILEKIEEIKL